MASLAWSNRVPESAAAATSDQTQPGDDRFAVRSLPNEDLYLFVKELDNSGVVREADPRARGAAWRMILSGGAIVTLLIGILLPVAYGRIAGFQIEALKKERAELLTEKAALEVKENAMLTPARMQIMAERQKLVDPGPKNMVYLEGQEESLALNGK